MESAMLTIPTERKQSAKHQYLAALVVSLLLVNYGVITGWTSPNIILLESDKSPLPTGAISKEESSWVASVIAIGGLIGNIVCGFVMNRFGRKWPMIFISIPSIISWMLVLFAQNVYYLYVARFLHGIIIGAILVICPVYLIEIASDRVRGVLASTVGFNGNLGILTAFTLGNYCNFYTTPIVAIVTIILFAVVFFFFPETPMYLVSKQNKRQDAEKSIQFYQNIRRKNSEQIDFEITKLQSAIGSNEGNKSDKNHLKWSDFTIRPGSRAMMIGAAMVILNQFSGITAMLSYTATIFEAAGTSFEANTSAMIVAAIQFVGTCVVTPIIDIAGRRFLYFVSTIGTALCQVILGAYMMLRASDFDVESFSWVPIVSFSAALFLASFAIGPLPIAVTAEVMPQQLKEFGVTFSMILLSISGFVVIKCLPLGANLIGFHGCIFIFAGVCLLGTLFVYVFLPETKGKSYDEIMNSLR